MSDFGQVAIRKAQREDDGTMRTVEIEESSSLRVKESNESDVVQLLIDIRTELKLIRRHVETMTDAEFDEEDIDDDGY